MFISSPASSPHHDGGEPPQDLRANWLIDTACQQEIGIAPLLHNDLSALLNTDGHRRRIKLWMKLEPPGVLADDKGLVCIPVAGGQQPGTIGEPQDLLIMADLDRQARSQAAQEGIPLTWPCLLDLYRSILQPARIVADLPA